MNIGYRVIRKCANTVRKVRLFKLWKKYGFNEWHTRSKISKLYVNDIVRYVAKDHFDGCIVECGCGLCDIIGDKRLSGHDRIAIDANQSICEEARELRRGRGIKIINGSFGDIADYQIGYLIAVNFVHEIPPEKMREYISEIVDRNEVKHFIFDEVTGNYKFFHHFEEIIPEGYHLKKTMGPYWADGGHRFIKIFERNEWSKA